MKRLLPLILALVAIVGVAPKASAQFSIGPRVGINVGDLKFDKATFDMDNRMGYCAGIEAELMFPVANLGFDISAMYVRRGSTLPWEKPDGGFGFEKMNNDYIEVPLNLKWKIGLPVVGKIVTPYVFTGPAFSFLAKKKSIEGAWKNFKHKNLDMVWNFGFGLQLFKKLQIGASYGLGLTSVLEKVNTIEGVDIENPLPDEPSEKIYDPKNRYWTITAAWLF